MFYFYLWVATQIITEMLPISSSGHLRLVQAYAKYLGYDLEVYARKNRYDLKKLYYLLHGPTLVIVVLYFGRAWFLLLFSGELLRIMVWVLIANGIMVIGYFVKSLPRYNRSLHSRLLGTSGYIHPDSSTLLGSERPMVCGIRCSLWRRWTEGPVMASDCDSNCIEPFLPLGFLITATALFSTAWCHGSTPLAWNYLHAVILGCATIIAFAPGISRLAISISMGCWLGYGLMDAFFLSWLMQAPLMAAAFVKALFSVGEVTSRLAWARSKRTEFIGGPATKLLNIPLTFVILMSSLISWYALHIVGLTIEHATFFYWGWYMGIPLLAWVVICKRGSYDDLKESGY